MEEIIKQITIFFLGVFIGLIAMGTMIIYNLKRHKLREPYWNIQKKLHSKGATQ